MSRALISGNELPPETAPDRPLIELVVSVATMVLSECGS
jgi:hypothetical protein